MCSLAAVLVVVAYNMSEWRAFRDLLRAPRSDVAVLLTTFGLTVIFDLTLAVQIGVVLAAFLFMKRMADVTRIAAITQELQEAAAGGDRAEETDRAALSKQQVPPGVQVYEVNGPFFFGAADKVRDVFNVVEGAPRVMVLRMRLVPIIDATGLHTLEHVHKNCAKKGTTLVLSGVCDQPARALRRSHLREMIGRNNITETIEEALQRSREILALPPNSVPQPAKKRKKKRRDQAA
jgi:SulP family sulfate permease